MEQTQILEKVVKVMGWDLVDAMYTTAVELGLPYSVVSDAVRAKLGPDYEVTQTGSKRSLGEWIKGRSPIEIKMFLLDRVPTTC